MAELWIVVGALGSLSVPILILLRYQWNQLDSPGEAEKWLEERLLDQWKNGSDYEIQVTRVVVFEPSGWRTLIHRYLFFQPIGTAQVEVKIRNKITGDRGSWDPSQFSEYSDIYDFEVEYSPMRPDSKKQYLVDISTLDKDEIYGFVRGLSTVPTIAPPDIDIERVAEETAEENEE